MTTETYYKNGKCDAFEPIRIKRWDSGFSIKCMKGKKTVVGRPYYEDMLRLHLKSFCDNCKIGVLKEEKAKP
jgi:hypothetical protein